MKSPFLNFLLLLLVLIPLIIFFIFGFTMTGQEQRYVRERFQTLLASRLADINDDLGGIINSFEREFLTLNHISSLSADDLRRWLRGQRMIRQAFVLSPEGLLLHPPEIKTAQEEDFLERTASVWQEGESFYKSWADSQDRIRDHGWYSWFWGSGVNIIFWQKAPGGEIVGFEVERAALIADVIGRLPDSTNLSPDLFEGRIVLTDVMEKIIYQWGIYVPQEGEKPLVRIPVDEPFKGWELKYYPDAGSIDSYLKNSSFLNLGSAVIIISLIFVAMALYFFRENSRAIREAAEKVSFVNQVSHELKTPLTNIRLYAELLESRIDPEDEKAANFLKVITSECRRLSRLILNVLTFAREKKNGITIRMDAGSIDRTINGVIENFGHSFELKGIETVTDLNAGDSVLFDEDALTQILSNILSNVEKYAASGRFVRIESRQEGELTTISVSDRGPGIPPGQLNNIFKPFTRLSNKLSDGVSGTGLGLTIARRLAVAHGGNIGVRKSDSSQGACFHITLHTPSNNKGEIL